MRRTLSALAVAVAAAALLASPAGAITNGTVDTANTYANVGAYIVKAPSGRISPICSGTLIAPRVFLTASHCTAYDEQELRPLGYTAYVSFDRSIPWGDKTSKSTKLLPLTAVVTNPGYNQTASDPGDIGALVLARSQNLAAAPLPSRGALDGLAASGALAGMRFTTVGYGLQDRITGGGPPVFTDENPVPRRYAFSSFNALTPAWLKLSENPATGNGGTCFGDSGGPNFTPSGVLAAITITGDSVCRATNVDYRLDTDPARTFLGYVASQYGVAVPLP